MTMPMYKYPIQGLTSIYRDEKNIENIRKYRNIVRYLTISEIIADIDISRTLSNRYPRIKNIRIKARNLESQELNPTYDPFIAVFWILFLIKYMYIHILRIIEQ